jgi:UDP-N-acetylmuramyl pentapeptide phosphotransferase/UDP-N-acetylglucosamine-1-phosphate transferase
VYGEGKRTWMKLGALFLPSLIVVLFDLLSLRMDAPTAGGLSFLAAILTAYLFFPKLRVRPLRLVLALALAVGVAALMAIVL